MSEVIPHLTGSINAVVKPTRSVVASVTVGPKTTTSLADLNDVDASGVADGNVLMYETSSNKFEVRPLVDLTSNNISSINGGSF